MEVLEHAKDAVAFIGLIGGDENVIDVANAVHAEGLLERGEFVDAGTAPGGPEIDQRVLLRGIRAQSLEAVGGDNGDVDRPSVELSDGGDTVGGFFGPFRRASETAEVSNRRIMVCEERVDGGAEPHVHVNGPRAAGAG